MKIDVRIHPNEFGRYFVEALCDNELFGSISCSLDQIEELEIQLTEVIHKFAKFRESQLTD